MNNQETEYIRELKAANDDLRSEGARLRNQIENLLKPSRAKIANQRDSLKIELHNARAIGQRLRDKLEFEMSRIGDAGDRDIADWDFFVSNVVLPERDK
jgi:hypothetical protein